MNRENEKKAANTGLKNKVYRSWYEDGMFEIGVGVLFLFIVLGLYLGFRFGLPAHFNLIVKLLWSAAYIGLGFGTCWLIRKLKEKLVWDKAARANWVSALRFSLNSGLDNPSIFLVISYPPG